MYSPKWHIGIELSQHHIQLVAAKKHRKLWSLCECWQQALPFDSASHTLDEHRVILRNILRQWRQKLPKNCSVSIALPSLRSLQKQVSLPNQMSLQQPELSWYLQAQVDQLFPMQAQELAVDYRIIGQQVYFNAARQSDITFWQDLLLESGYHLLAVDIAPIALRYLARHAQLPNECWLVYYRQNEWFWSGPISQPASYSHIQNDNPTQDNQSVHINQIQSLLTDDPEALKLPIYCISDHDIQGIEYRWDLLQAFHQYPIKLPRQLGDFVIAAGLALRHGDL